MIFYVHGFNSSKGGAKSKLLHERFGKTETIVDLSYHSGNYPDRIYEDLRLQVEEAITLNRNEDLVFVGTSLGAFWASRLAWGFNGKAVLLNPSHDPVINLLKYEGENKNFVTGEEYVLTSDVINDYKGYSVPRGIIPTIVALDKGDEVLDYKKALDFYEGSSKVVLFNGGSHRFDHLPELFKDIEELGNIFVEA